MANSVNFYWPIDDQAQVWKTKVHVAVHTYKHHIYKYIASQPWFRDSTLVHHQQSTNPKVFIQDISTLKHGYSEED
jgi:hypothetical protein